MTKLEEYFEQDCGSAEAMSLYEAYEKGYNRAQIEFLEQQLKDLKNKAEQWYIHHWLDEVYNSIKGDYYERNY